MSFRLFTPGLRPSPARLWKAEIRLLPPPSRPANVAAAAPPQAPPLLGLRGLHSHSRPTPSSSPTPAPKPLHPSTPSSQFQTLARRAFSASSQRRVRSYYPRSGNSYGRRGGPRGPWSTLKDRLDALPSLWVLGGVIAVNVGVYATWQYGEQLAVRFRDPSLLIFLRKNFTTSWTNFSSGRVWTLVTACFSHEGTGHILLNMMSLFFMAPPVMAMLGNSGFLALYLFAGVVSSTVSLVFHQLGNASPYYASHGASGAVYGVLSYFAAAFPRTTFLIFFVVPCPAWLCVSGLFAWDLWSTFNRPGGRTDSMGHVGGVLAGLGWFARKKFGL